MYKMMIGKKVKIVIINQAIIILLLLVAIVGFSYAYFGADVNLSNTVLPNAKADVSCLHIEITNESELSFTSSVPISDENAFSTVTPVIYSVTNRCTTETRYNVALSTFSSNDSSHVNDSQIKIHVTKKVGSAEEDTHILTSYLNDLLQFDTGKSLNYINNKVENDSSLSSYSTVTNYVIDSLRIQAGETITYKIYKWIDSASDDTDNKYFKSILSLVENAEYYSIGGFSVPYKEFNGTEYISTEFQLFTEDNYMRDFELGFTIDNFDVSRFRKGQGDTVFNSLLESSPYPGILFRMQDNKWMFQAGSGIGTNKKIYFGQGAVETFKVRRISGKIYYSVNGGDYIYAADLSTLSSFFDTPVTFGVGLDANNNPLVAKYLVGGISDMYVKYIDVQNEIVDYDTIDEQILAFIGEDLTTAYNDTSTHTFDGTAATGFSTNVSLFSAENYQKSFWVALTIDDYVSASQKNNQATLFDAKDEHNQAADYPGIVLRKESNALSLAFKDGTGLVSSVTIPSSANRINIIKKGMAFYYQYDSSEIHPIGSDNSFANFDPANCFDIPATFGSILTANGQSYERVMVGTLSNLSIKVASN